MAILGNKNRFYIKVSNSYTWLAGEQSNNMNRTQEAIEVSDKSTDWMQHIGGKKGFTVDGTVHADNNDAAQVAVLNALYNGEKVDIFVGQLGDNSQPSDGEVGKGIVTSIGDTNDFGAVAIRSISITGSGALTHYPAFPQ